MKQVIQFILLVLSFPLFAQTKHFSKEDLSYSTKSNLEEKFTLFEIHKFNPDTAHQNVFLENGYASSKIKNRKEWPIKGIKFLIISK